MKLRDVLAGVTGGSFQLVLKFVDNSKLSIRVSEMTNLLNKIGQQISMLYPDPMGIFAAHVDKMQIVIDENDYSGNKLYLLLNNQERSRSKRKSTSLDNCYIIAPKDMVKYVLSGSYEEIKDPNTSSENGVPTVMAVHIVFPDIENIFTPSITMMLGGCSLRKKDWFFKYRFNSDIKVPDEFSNEAIKPLPITDYVREYKVNENTASKLIFFSQIKEPGIEDYIALSLDGKKDYWSKMSIGSTYMPAQKKLLILSVLSLYFEDLRDISDAFRWYMRGLPLKHCIKLVLAKKEGLYNKK